MGIFEGLFFKKRKYERFLVQDGVFVIIIKKESNWLVNVVDVSIAGLSFIYQGTPKELEETGFIKMFNQSTNEAKLKYETVFDNPTSDEKYRKRGIKFDWFGNLSKQELRDFIKQNSLLTSFC